jgi:hypothetical protein
MKTMYNVRLSADMHPGEEKYENPSELYDSDWDHSATTLEAIAEFVVRIIGRNPDWMPVICEKLRITKYCDRDNDGFFAWENTKLFDVKEINNLIQKESDRERLYNYICEHAEDYAFGFDNHLLYDQDWDSEGNEWIQEYIDFE